MSLEASCETEITKYTPYFKQIIDDFQCPLLSVRLLALPPGGKIGEHCDGGIGFNSGIVRLHIPIITHPDVVFFLGGERMRWDAGELWFGDFSHPHSVENRSPVTRYHMVLDVGINEFLLGLFPEYFIEKVLSQEVKYIEPPIELSNTKLESFICSFNIPSQMMEHVFNMINRREAAIQQARMAPAVWGQEAGRGGTQLLDGRLIVLVEGKTYCALEPLPGDKFRAVGMPNLTLKFQRTGEHISSIDVTMGDELLTVLPVSSSFAQTK